MFYYFLKKVLFAGCLPGMTPSLQLRLRIMNGVILSSICLVLPALIGFTLAGFQMIGLICASFIACACLPLYLNLKKRVKSSRVLTILMAIACLLIGVTMLPPGVRFENFFFGLSLLPFLLFENDESSERVLYSSLAIVGYLYSLSISGQAIANHEHLVLSDSAKLPWLIIVQIGVLAAVLVPAFILINQSQKNEASFKAESFLRMKADKMAALGELSAGIAHEINNPLAVMKGRVEQLRLLAKSEAISQKNLPEILDALRVQIDRTSEIVKGLRSYSRSSDSEDFECHDLSKIAYDAIEMCRLKASRSGVELRVEGELPAFDINCRPVEIMQILVNLINNGIDANNGRADSWVQLEIDETSDRAIVMVTDSGPGIDKHLRESIMEPFFTTKAIGEGTGLGLNLSKFLADAHMGAVRLDSQYHHTRFIVELPKFGEAEASADEHALNVPKSELVA